MPWILLLACAPGDAPPATLPHVALEAPEAPIQVFANAHGHNYHLSATPADDDWWEAKTDRFVSDRDSLFVLTDLVASYGGVLSAQLSGEFARDAVHLVPESVPELRALLDRGHTLGAHFHDEALAEQEEWQSLRIDGLTDDEQAKIWQDHLEAVEALAGQDVLRVDAAEAPEDASPQAFAGTWEARLAAAGDAFTYAGWAHPLWTPARPAAGTQLRADPEGPQVRLGSTPQIGKSDPSGLHVLPSSVVQLQRHFLQVWSQWTWDQLDPDTPRLWTFGLMTHPGQLDLSEPELDLFLAWLQETFGAAEGPAGTPVYELVSDEQILTRFLAWEDDHPGEVSFDFDVEGWLEGACVTYPYPLEGLTLALRDAEVAQDMRLGGGVRGWRLRTREILRGERDETGHHGVGVGDLGAEVWVLASRDGQERQLDLRNRLPAEVWQVDPRTGDATVVDQAAIRVGALPIVLLEDLTALDEARADVACP